MIRKGIIVVLTLLAFSTVAVYIDSYVTVHKSHRWWARVWDLQRDFAKWLPKVRVCTSRGRLLVQQYPRRPIPWPLYEFSVLGFRRTTSLSPGFVSPGYVRYLIPLWMPFILFATYPTIAFIRGPLRRYRRRKRGLCIRCGYNLTGNTTGVCSGCGAGI